MSRDTRHTKNGARGGVVESLVESAAPRANAPGPLDLDLELDLSLTIVNIDSGSTTN